jgi:beta-galactosidase
VRRTRFNDGWKVRPKVNRFAELGGQAAEWQPVTLPHDAMIGTSRSPSASAGNAYFPGGVWEYSKTLDLTSDDAGTSITLEFEGVYRDAVVLVNGSFAAQRPYGYSLFQVPIDHLLRYGETNEIRVECRALEDSRWYSGAGIYRSVWLLQAGRVHIGPDGPAVRTPEIDDDGATITVATPISNCSGMTSRLTLHTELIDAVGRVMANDRTPVVTYPGDDLVARQRIFLAPARRWDPDDPYLYTCRVTLLDGGHDDADVVDVDETTFGIRSLALDPRRGLRINGKQTVLRGACVHHDNGPLGSATVDAAEHRRVRLLKDAGFNSLRSAHHPMSRAMLDACDRLGVLVMDETFDMWQQAKSDRDYSLRFNDWWRADVESMVRKDQNRPSVILYSIGNEIPDEADLGGVRIGHEMAELVRSLDDSRYVTKAVTGFLVGGLEAFAELRETMSADHSGPSDHVTPAGASEETGVNGAATQLAEFMKRVVESNAVTAKTTEPFSYLDVAGYNYMENRYDSDAERFPHRLIVATETYPPAIAEGWAGLLRHPNVIGDFTWTGWDYLGEVGIGRVEYGDEPGAAGMGEFSAPFPWVAAWCGDIDITGARRPASYYRETVFGLRSAPYIAVQPPSHHGRFVIHISPWSFPDVISSWTWPGHESTPLQVEVYSDADEVELLVNGRSCGRQPAGAEHDFRARFEACYEPGQVEAIAWRAGNPGERTVLRTATGPVRLSLHVDRPELTASTVDAAFVEIQLVDETGELRPDADRSVTVTVEGAGTLQGLASANPRSEESFTAAACMTYAGRALAVVRPTDVGSITITVAAEGCSPQQISINAAGPDAAGTSPRR